MPTPREKRESDLKAIVPVNSKFRKDANGKPICGALTRSGGQCKRPPMENGRCRVHGGSTPVGINSPNFKHGRYSKYLPKEMNIVIGDMLNAPDPFNQMEQLGILDALLIETLRDFTAGGGGSIWVELTKKVGDYHKATAKKDPKGMSIAISEIIRVVESGNSKYLASQEAREVIEGRRRITESERKRRVEEKTMIPVEKVVGLLSAIGSSIMRHVTDEYQRQAVVDDVQKAMGSFAQREYDAHAHYEAPPDDDEIRDE